MEKPTELKIAAMRNIFKQSSWLFLLGILFVGIAGCGKSDANSNSIGAKPNDRVELTAVLNAFAGEDVSMRSTLEELANMVRSEMNQDALPRLIKLSSNPQLKPDQKQALDNLIASLKTNGRSK